MLTGTHPTKEQVRAYMHRRGQAHRPPPAPDEIRRQLGWNWPCQDSAAYTLIPASPHCLLLPGTIAQLSALLAVEWLFLAAGCRRSR